MAEKIEEGGSRAKGGCSRSSGPRRRLFPGEKKNHLPEILILTNEGDIRTIRKFYIRRVTKNRMNKIIVVDERACTVGLFSFLPERSMQKGKTHEHQDRTPQVIGCIR